MNLLAFLPYYLIHLAKSGEKRSLNGAASGDLLRHLTEIEMRPGNRRLRMTCRTLSHYRACEKLGAGDRAPQAWQARRK